MIIRSDNYITNPTVACGIVVYNQKEFIAQCIEGMLKQECDFPFNIVISDDCSTDGTQDILREYQSKFPDKIKLVLNETNGHIAKNWVSCARALEGGEFVSFCDGDDCWSNPHKLQMQVEYLRQHSKCVAVSTDYDTSDKLYFEPLTLEDVLSIYYKEKPLGVIAQFGGQTPLNLAADLKKNGINILGTAGCQARSIFDGEVSAVFSFGGTMVVMVRHGSYISVYCNLASVSVSRGQKVSTRQILGSLGSDHILQFQLRKETAKLNPESWLAR